MKVVKKYVIRPNEVNEIETTRINQLLFAGNQENQIVLFIEEWIESGAKTIEVNAIPTNAVIEYLRPDEYICTAIFPDTEYHIYKLF